MKNKLVLGLIIAVMLVAVPGPALAWGSATHLYLAEKLGNKDGDLDNQEMYGATLIDVFNLMFGYPYQDYLWNETHYEFMKLYQAAEPEEQALGYGFVSHNELWGADHTAHIQALTIEGSNGYVVIKSMELAPLLMPQIIAAVEEVLGPLPDPPPPIIEEIALTLADNGVESAVDYLISQNEDKKVGERMYNSANERDSFVPLLLSEAYAPGLANEALITLPEANAIIMTTESAFQAQIMNYGTALMAEDAMEAMVAQGTQLAIEMIEAEFNITVPSEAVPVIEGLMEFTLIQAIGVVEDDYAQELEATQKYVKQQLNKHKIKTYRQEN